MDNERASPDIAIVGCGRWGKNHVRAWNTLGRLLAVCDSDPINLATVRDEYPHVELVPHVSDLLDRKDVRAVVLATPASTHADLGLQVLKVGKDLLVEKPMALDVAEGEALVAVARERGLILGVGHVLEYHPAVRRLKELVSSGALGRVRYLYSNRLNMGTIRTEENALWSFAPHDIAVTLRLVGTFPNEISCAGAGYLNSAVADVTLTSMGFASGVRAHVFVSWLHPFKEQRFVVVGDEQMAVFDDTAPWDKKLVLYPHKVHWKDGQVPIARKAEAIPIELEESEPLLSECIEFASAVDSRRDPLTDGESGLDVLKVLRMAQQDLEISGSVRMS